MFNTLKADLQGNPRLRLWLALIVGAIGLYSLLVMREALQNAEQRERAASLAIGRLRAQLGQAEWLERLAPAQVMRAQMEGRLWQAPTGGLAQAALQDWLTAALAQAKATKTMLTVTVTDEITADASTAAPAPAGAAGDGTAPTPPDLWKIKAAVGFDFDQTSLFDLLQRIEKHDKHLVVNALSVRKEPPSRVEIELLGYFQKQAAKP
jgi:hypothetical protein